MSSRLFWKIFWSFWLNFLLQLFLMWMIFTFVIAVGPGIIRMTAERSSPRELELAAELVAAAGPLSLPRHSDSAPIDVSAATTADPASQYSRSAVAPDGRTYRLTYRMPPPAKSSGTVPPEVYGVGLISGLLSAALLAFYLVRPIRWLKAGFETFAAGDLRVRLTPRIGGRRDEIADLARDFDGMADKIEQLVQARDQLLDDVSHELRSPIARLQLAIALARQKTARREDVLERIEREAARLDWIVSGLLTLSRLESGAPMVDGYFDVTGLLADIAADATFEGQSGGVIVDARIGQDAEPSLQVAGDSELIRRAIDNVVRNALRFSPKPGVVILCLTRTQASILISVADDGPGVAPDRLATMFAPFVKGEGGGWGLGLAIAQRALVAHGGTIKALNRPSGGLEITMILPVVPMLTGSLGGPS